MTVWQGTALAVLWFVPVVVASAQDAGGADPAAAENAVDPTEVATPAPNLFQRTLIQDVSTAPDAELLDWAASIGLSVRGSRSEVEARLLAHYGVAAPQPEGTPAPPAEETTRPSLVRIDSASRTAFERIDAVDQQILRLVGGVELILEDAGARHSIRSDSIVLNLETNLLEARGNVVYSVERDRSAEEFRGDSAVFRLDRWDGVFIGGRTQTRESLESEEIDFTVQGARISRSPEEIVVVDGGSITSSEATPPNYRIEAERIWLLAPGEWGLRGATLFVGRVPLFRLPVFFLPGDRFFFHPTAGYRAREGSFLQTTTYFIGESDEVDPPISILQLAEADDDSPRVRDGLFLRPPSEPIDPRYPEDWYLRGALDVYSRLGVYGALEARVTRLGALDSLEGRVALAASRALVASGESYTSFVVTPDGDTTRAWVVPRYDVDVDSRFSLGRSSFVVSGRALSDPFVPSDFGNRSESFDWGVLLESGPGTTTGPPSVTSLNWLIDGRWTPQVAALGPWITSFSVSSARVRLDLASRIDQHPPDGFTSAAIDDNPLSRFWYPTRVTLPSIALRIRGEPFSLVGGRSEATLPEGEEFRDGASGLRPPWTVQRPDAPPVASAVIPPAPLEALTGIVEPAPPRLGVTYTVSPSLDHVLNTADDGWTTASDVTWEMAYGTVDIRSRTDAVVSGTAPGVTSRLNLVVDPRWQILAPREALSDDRETALTAAARTASRIASRYSTQIRVQPLTRIPAVAETTVEWALAGTGPTYAYPAGDLSAPAELSPMTADDISSHRVALSVVGSTWGDPRVTVRSALPPLDPEFDFDARLITGPVSSALSGGVELVEGAWNPSPITQSHALSLADGRFSLSQRVEYDLDAVAASSLTTSAALGPATAQFTARRSGAAVYTEASGWQTSDDVRMRGQQAIIALQDSISLTRWMGRIGATLDGSLTTTWNLQQVTDSRLRASYGFSLTIVRFLTLEIEATSRNDAMFQYIPQFANRVGLRPRNIVEDLWASISVWDDAARRSTPFTLDQISLRAVHDLRDWEVRVSYDGRPVLDTDRAVPRFRWSSSATILIRWRPISEIEREIRVRDGEILDEE